MQLNLPNQLRYYAQDQSQVWFRGGKRARLLLQRSEFDSGLSTKLSMPTDDHFTNTATNIKASILFIASRYPRMDVMKIEII